MIRLDDGESAELITPLTEAFKTYVGNSDESVSTPTYTSTNYIVNGENLTLSLGKLDAGVGLHAHTGLGDGSNTLGSAPNPVTLAGQPTITDYTNALHDHGTAAAGGNLAADTVGATQLVNNLVWSDVFPTAAAGDHSHSTNLTGGLLDHGGLAGLGDDDHIQYGQLADAEGATGIWDFANGLQVGLIRLANSDIFERDTDADNAVISINRLGYNSGATRFRDTTIYDGKLNQLLSVDGGTGSVYIVDANARLYAGTDDPPSTGTNRAAGNISADRHITSGSQAKAWCFATTGAGGTTVHKGYNIDNISAIGVPGANQVTVTFRKDFLDVNYTCIAIDGDPAAGNGSPLNTTTRGTHTLVIGNVVNTHLLDLHIFGELEA